MRGDRIFSSKASIEFQFEQAFKNGSKEIKICIRGSNGEKVTTHPIHLKEEFQSILNREDDIIITRDKNLILIAKCPKSAVNVLNKTSIKDVAIEKTLFENSFTSQYIVKGIDPNTSNEEIERQLLSQGIHVHKIVRFTRKWEYALSSTVLIKELGKVDRKLILFNLFPTQVQKFIEKPKICNKCLKVGHFQTRCYAKEPKCQKCGGDHEAFTCSKVDNNCFRCGSHDHTALDIQCPVVKEEQEVLNLVNEKNISLSMARSLIEEEKAKKGESLINQKPTQSKLSLAGLNEFVDFQRLGLKGLMTAIEELTEAVNTLANFTIGLLENQNHQIPLREEVEERNNSAQSQQTSRST